MVCSKEEEWQQLAESFKKSKHKDEKMLYETLSVDFVPEIGKMIEAKVKVFAYITINYHYCFLILDLLRILNHLPNLTRQQKQQQLGCVQLTVFRIGMHGIEITKFNLSFLQRFTLKLSNTC